MNAGEMAAYQRNWRDRHAADLRTYQRKRYQSKRDKILEAARVHYRENREEILARRERRRHTKHICQCGCGVRLEAGRKAKYRYECADRMAQERRDSARFYKPFFGWTTRREQHERSQQTA